MLYTPEMHVGIFIKLYANKNCLNWLSLVLQEDILSMYCQTPVLGLELGVDFTYAGTITRITITTLT